jgi:hypothetical protein
MVTIQLDEQTAKELQRQAKTAGVTVAEFVRSLVPSPAAPPRPSWDELETEILALSSSGPSLPADFSRADIYGEHD